MKQEFLEAAILQELKSHCVNCQIIQQNVSIMDYWQATDMKEIIKENDFLEVAVK